MDERAFKALANEWSRVEGERLNEQNDPAWDETTARLDAMVARGIERSRTRSVVRWASLAAACLVLIAGVWTATRLGSLNLNPSQGTPSEYASDAASDADGAPDALASDASDEPAATSDAQPPKVMELAFALPARFTVASVEMDNGATIYTLADSMRDDVVLSMEAGALEPSEGMTALEIGGTLCYGKSNSEYSVLLLEREGVVYRLSCRWELGTLAGLAEGIVGG